MSRDFEIDREISVLTWKMVNAKEGLNSAENARWNRLVIERGRRLARIPPDGTEVPITDEQLDAYIKYGPPMGFAKSASVLKACRARIRMEQGRKDSSQ